MTAQHANTFAGPGPGPGRVLVVRLGALGDVVRTLPALRLIRRTWPESEVAWAVESSHSGLLAGHPDIDRLLVLERSRLQHAVKGLRSEAFGLLRAFISSVRQFGPDLALDFQSSLKSGLVCRLSGAPVRWGFARKDSRESSHIFATHHLPLPEPRTHRVERAASLARAAGALEGPLVADLALSPEELRSGRRIVEAAAGGRPALALAPFSSRRQAWKRYPLDAWAEVASRLSQGGATVLVVAGPAERQEARALIERAGAGVALVEDEGIRSLAAILAACRLFVGGDTGPMHIAWAVGTPVVALYGPTDPALNAPYGDGHVVLAPPAPTGRADHDRFPGLGPERVATAALRRLETVLQGAPSPGDTCP